MTGTGVSAQDDSFRAQGLVAFDTVNGNAASTVVEYLRITAADAVAGQETRVAGEKARSAQMKDSEQKRVAAIQSQIDKQVLAAQSSIA